LWRIWFSAHSQSQYFPLVFTTLRLEYQLWGLNPVGYHVVNVCLHIVNALLVWALLRRLALPSAWLAAAIWALHPVQVETVAWVTELKNTESTLFYLLAIFAWLSFSGGKGGKFYTLAIFLHLLALFAKTMACTLPAVLLLVLWLKNEPINRRRILQTLPFLALGIGMGLLSVWWENHLGNYQPQFHLLGGPLDRLIIATHALWFYAGKIFWPVNLTFTYPRWNIQPADWQQFLWFAGCLAVASAFWLARKKLGHKPGAAVIFFAAALSPMIGFIPLYTFYFSYVADHYQYFACLGLIALAVAAAGQFLEFSGASRLTQTALAALLLLTLATLTWQQCHIYKNKETLWTDTLQKNPRSWMAHTNLGRLRAQQGDLDGAEKHYLSAIDINPDDVNVHYDYGNLLARENRLDKAEAGRLAAAVARGDEAAFRELYDRYHHRLFRFALVLGRGDETLAHDAVQAVFVTAAKKLRAAESEKHLWNWLARVARQQLAKAWRQRRRDYAVIGMADLPECVDGVEPDSVLEESLDAALLAMDADERELVEWFYFDQLSHKEIAERLGATPKSVSSRLERARVKLRSVIARKLSHET
jgi:RNA polymerase sigma factor (sigma-70 family)